jgi:hypothetical protein
MHKAIDAMMEDPEVKQALDQLTLDFGAGRGSQTFSWDLRQVR